MKALNKNLFPSGNISLEDIISETKLQKKMDDNTEEIVINGENQKGPVDFNIGVPSKEENKTRNERRELERKEKKNKKNSIKEARKRAELEKRKEDLEKIKSKTKEEIKTSCFSEQDAKRIKQILFNSFA